MISEKPKYTVVPGADLNKSFRESAAWITHSFYSDQVEEAHEEKIWLLRKDFKNFSNLLAAHRIPFPKNPCDRIRFLEPYPYEILAEEYDVNRKFLGFTSPLLRFGFLDIVSIERDEEKDGAPKGALIRGLSIHELSHCLETTEWWKELGSEDSLKIKRSGFAVGAQRKVDHCIYSGGIRINEGLADYLMINILSLDPKFANLQIPYYYTELEIINFLAASIGLGPLFRAAFTKNGYIELNREMTRVFDKGSLRWMLKWVGDTYLHNEEQNSEKTDEQKTKPNYEMVIKELSFRQLDMAEAREECLV
jgi:hypothetical protein